MYGEDRQETLAYLGGVLRLPRENKMNRVRGLPHFFAAGLLLCQSWAGAEEPAESEEGPESSKMNLSIASPGAPVQRTDFLHEGFYFRFSGGPGFMTTSVKDKGTDTKASATDFSLGSDLLIGGSPAPGMTFGGGMQGNLALSTDPTFSYLVGPFFDAFPNRKQGFHLGTMLGFAGASTSTGPNSSLFGGGLSAWGGYDIWVAPEWSVGFNLRGTGAQLVSSDANATNFSMHFLITVLNH